MHLGGPLVGMGIDRNRMHPSHASRCPCASSAAMNKPEQSSNLRLPYYRRSS
ncbi:hypothetical protein HETIRDRAFT_173455 [Heterobasidion irregulare TC 32-1]|uniref:Uncharacterized protein n=1 Tax=Heterobasidion irregulare (strain TC 32-1) TaxID=747525 RepID=W4K7M4_HETIT|nr:uncharacterized protein HETIRDRAFT_173455 [Heterobasidion irregulare TC 32-1]ETW81778.1 hypothetical protein HETIRDRAFT_173455 [Heterobasidion irregulare TC 32-1]